jgi:hypothetical protein
MQHQSKSLQDFWADVGEESLSSQENHENSPSFRNVLCETDFQQWSYQPKFRSAMNRENDLRLAISNSVWRVMFQETATSMPLIQVWSLFYCVT